MTFLFAHNNADLYGSSRSLIRLSTRLVRDGHEVHAVLPFEGDLSEALDVAGVGVHILSGMAVIERSAFKSATGLISFLFRLPISIIRLMRLIHRLAPNIVHSNTSVMLPSALAARLGGRSHVWHIRESYSEFPAFWRIYERLMAFCSRRIICVSAAVQEQFKPSIRQKKTVVIHNGFPIDEFARVEPGRVEQFKRNFGLDGFKLVGLVGRIILQRKGQDVFVKAAALLRERFSDVRFLIIGSCYPGNEFHGENLNRLIDELNVGDVVVQTGDVDDIKAAYAALDISVLASARPEPFGGVVIESMAYGKPVVGTNLGGTSEQIADGETGILIPPNDLDAMAHAVARLLDDDSLRGAMGEAGRRRFESEFEFETFYQRMQGLYGDVLK